MEKPSGNCAELRTNCAELRGAPQTANGFCAAASAIVAIWERSPISAATVSVNASPTRGQPPFRSAPVSCSVFSASSRSSSIPDGPPSSIASASVIDLMPKKMNDAIAT